MRLKTYRWTAQDRFKQRQQGNIIGNNEQQICHQLQQKGLNNIKLQQNWQLSTKPSQAEICDLLLQLAILLKSAVPLKTSLMILLQNSQNIQLYQWLNRLLNDLERGFSFSKALQHQNKFLTLQEQQLIQVGELTGKLAQVCQQLANHRQQSLILQRKIQKILLYPLLILSISLILTALLLIFIVPQFAEMYANNKASLPFFTQLLLHLSAGLRQGFVWVIFISLFITFKFYLLQQTWFQQIKSGLQQRFPLINAIIRLDRLVSFSQNLHLMLSSGVPLHQALQSFLPTPNQVQRKSHKQSDPVLIREVQFALRQIQQGYPFSQSVNIALFPLQAQQMLQVGEKSGELAQMLKHIADSYRQQLEHKIDLLSQLIEPLLMVIIGGLIGLIMLGMYLPIFNMGSLMQ